MVGHKPAQVGHTWGGCGREWKGGLEGVQYYPTPGFIHSCESTGSHSDDLITRGGNARVDGLRGDRANANGPGQNSQLRSAAKILNP